jgi:hypothetical protein
MQESVDRRSRIVWALALAGIAALPFAYPAFGLLAAPDAHWVTVSGTHFGLDFVNFWSGGRLALEGRVVDAYNPEAYKALLAAWFAPATRFTNLSYPPSLLPWLTPFAALPYLASYALWSLIGVAAFVAACLGRLPKREDAFLVGVLIIAPVTVSNVVFGQIAPLMTLLFIAAFRILPTQPVAAGVLIGLMTLKPQLGVLLPVFLLAIGGWRTIAAAAVTALALVALSAALFGPDPWRAYLTDTAALQWSYILAMRDFYAVHMVTPYAGLWALGVPVAIALKVQWVISAAIVVVTWIVARSSADWPLKVAILALGSVMAVPYVLGHDLALPLAALVWFALSRPEGLPRGETILIALLWLLPFPLTFLLQMFGIPGTEVVMAALYVLLVARALELKVPAACRRL